MSHSTHFSTLMIILLLYVEAHHYFHIHIHIHLKKWNLLSYNACSTIIHARINCGLDYCNVLLYNVPTHKTDDCRLQNQCARILTKSPRREHITTVFKTYIGSKFRIESYTKHWCLHINRIIILHRLIYVNWLAGENVIWILCLGPIITNLLCHQLVGTVQTLFLSILSCILLHANGTNWDNISGHQILINSGRVC